MPADRFLHPRAGRSRKITLLTDLEYRVWTQYLLSADDFGVMRGTSLVLQNDNLHLANRPAKLVKRCLDVLVKSGLVKQFEHQEQPYIFQPDWQLWQKVEYPRATVNPHPTGTDLEACDETTRALFAKHPGGQRKDRRRSEDPPSDSERASQIAPPVRAESIPPTRAGACETATAKANGIGQRLTANGHQPIIARRRLDAAWEGPKVYVPQRVHTDFLALRNGDESSLLAWYEVVSNEWVTGSRKAYEPGSDMIRFWKARYDERWPATSATPAKAGKWDHWTPKPAVQR